MIHSFDIDDAVKYGMTEAVILYNLRFWIEKNKANNKHYHDGRYWTYNSVKAFEELFPYLTYRNIRSAIEKLEKLNVIVTGNYNQSNYDRTRWFALFDLSELTNGFVTEGKTVDRYKQDIKTDAETSFLLFWSAYPKKVSKPDALKAWKKIKPSEDLINKIIASVESSKNSQEWKNENGKYIPYPASWLNSARWEDGQDENAKPKPKTGDKNDKGQTYYSGFGWTS